jgi:molybdenum cofactor biosynthesis protein MoaC
MVTTETDTIARDGRLGLQSPRPRRRAAHGRRLGQAGDASRGRSVLPCRARRGHHRAAVERLAGIQGAKATATLVPLAHPLPLDQVEVELEPLANGVRIASRVVATARTGAEMEALAACAAAALALYDMVKAIDRGAVITDLRLERKSGGARGDWERDARETMAAPATSASEAREAPPADGPDEEMP